MTGTTVRSATPAASLPAGNGSEPPVIELRGIHKSYGALEVIKGVDLTWRGAATSPR